MRISTRALLLLLGGIFCLLACNLTRTPPTPSPAPTTEPGQVVTSIAPTLFASITPLGFNGGGSVIATSAPAGSGSSCTPPANWVQYTVQNGDSLGDLANATGVTVQDIVNANCLANPDQLFSGQQIYLPKSPISG